MPVADEDLALESLDSIFARPPSPPPPSPTVVTYQRKRAIGRSDEPGNPAWDEIYIRLVGKHPLWGHLLWNAAKSIAAYLDVNPELYRDKNVLELGAGGGLPGIVTAINGAANTLLTDYPDTELIENLELNVIQNLPPDLAGRVSVQGYIWGRLVDPLLQTLQWPSGKEKRGFDLIILSEIVFNHSQHDALLTTCESVLAPTQEQADGTPSAPPPCVLVFYTHTRPKYAHRDLEFFSKARARGWTCEKIVKDTFPLMFPEDPGDASVRSTVHGWKLLYGRTVEREFT